MIKKRLVVLFINLKVLLRNRFAITNAEKLDRRERKKKVNVWRGKQDATRGQPRVHLLSEGTSLHKWREQVWSVNAYLIIGSCHERILLPCDGQMEEYGIWRSLLNEVCLMWVRPFVFLHSSTCKNILIFDLYWIHCLVI